VIGEWAVLIVNLIRWIDEQVAPCQLAARVGEDGRVWIRWSGCPCRWHILISSAFEWVIAKGVAELETRHI